MKRTSAKTSGNGTGRHVCHVRGATGTEGFIPLGTPGDTELLLLHVEYLRHEVFTTTLHREDGSDEEWSWNVTEGYELAEALGEEPVSFDPAEMGITPEHVLARYPRLDIRHALTKSDLSKPVLFVPCSETVDGERHETALLIDGWHRLMRSVIESGETGEPRPLLARFLTAGEERAVRIAPEDEETQKVAALPATALLRELSRRVKRQTGFALSGR